VPSFAVAPFYGGGDGVRSRLDRAAAALDAYHATGEVRTVRAYAEGDDRAGMFLPLDYYAAPDRGAIGSWRNDMAELSWLYWLTFNGLAEAERVTTPSVFVHSDDCMLPDNVRSIASRMSNADLPAVVVRTVDSGRRAVVVGALAALDVTGRAVLLHTGGDKDWGTPEYVRAAPFLTEAASRHLVDRGARLVGIDAVNIDDIDDLRRPAHSLPRPCRLGQRSRFDACVPAAAAVARIVEDYASQAGLLLAQLTGHERQRQWVAHINSRRRRFSSPGSSTLATIDHGVLNDTPTAST
jgi:Putative cyclase